MAACVTAVELASVGFRHNFLYGLPFHLKLDMNRAESLVSMVEVQIHEIRK